MKIFFSVVLAVVFSFASSLLMANPASGESPAHVHTLVNINTADVTALSQLKGIGSKKAEAIIAWREANGDFKTVEQLLDVKGIGQAILDANRDKITI